MAYEIQLTIAEVMNDISKNKYVLPYARLPNRNVSFLGN